MASRSRAVAVRTRYVSRPRSRRSGNGGGRKVPLAVVLGMVPGVTFALSAPDNTQKLDRFVSSYTGYFPSNGQFNKAMLSFGLYPLIVGFMAHGLAGAFGINRWVAKMRLPVEI